MSILEIILLAVGLSMDAFSLALIYGTLNLNKKTEKLMSIIVGIFHFIMPIIGYYLGKKLVNIIKINPDLIVGVIFIILGIEMLTSIKKEEHIKVLTNIVSIMIFAFTVSIDSFTIGIAFIVTDTIILKPCFIFSITSLVFTYLGLKLGKKLSTIFGDISILLGASILTLLGVKYLL